MENKKQYIMMCDEMHVALMSKMMPGLQFLLVEGMGIPENDTHQILVSPIKKVENADTKEVVSPVSEDTTPA